MSTQAARHLVLASALVAASAAAVAQPAPGRLISARDLLALKNDAGVVILHVADRPQAFADGHLPDARFIRYGDIAVDGPEGLGSELPPMEQLQRVLEEAGVSGSSHVVVYGNTVPAARLFFTLDVVGHPRVSLLDGGLRAWQEADGAVERGAPAAAPKRGSFTPKLNRDRMATADWIRDHASGIALVDVRPDPEFTGEDGGMGGMHAAGHIEGARQLPWNALTGPDGRFLPADELRAKLAQAGGAPGKPIVSYCMVGMRASVVYFVARHLGLDAKLYDGSIIDWGRRGLPTKTGR